MYVINYYDLFDITDVASVVRKKRLTVDVGVFPRMETACLERH
jgi:hypothetical protein